MSDDPYTNRELKAIFKSITEKLDEHGHTHDKILQQVLYTNGKVRRLYILLAVLAGFTLSNSDTILGLLKYAI